MTITSEDSYYVLRFDRDAYNEKVDAGADLGDEGVEEAFDLVAEISEKFINCPPIQLSSTDSPLASRLGDGLEIASSTPHLPTS